MSSKNDGDYKKFVKKRIRKDDNSVDNDLSSDDEKWMDKFDTEVQKAREVDPAVLPRCQLIPYVQSILNVKRQKKLIQEFNITDEELKSKPKSVEVPPELIKGTENIDPELKEYIVENVHLSCSSSSTSVTTCSTCSCSCSTSPSTGEKIKDNKKADEVTEVSAQPNLMSPMRLHLMKPRTPSTSDSSSLSTYKSSWQCSSTSSSSSSSSTTLHSEKPVQDNKSQDIHQSQVEPLAAICKNIVVDVFEKAKLGLPPSGANMPSGKENQPPEKRIRRSSSTRERRFSSSPEEQKKASKHSSDMSLTPVVSRSPQVYRFLRSSARSTGSVSSLKSTSSKRAGKSSKKCALGESLGSASMSLTPKESPSSLESVSEVTSSSDDSSTAMKKTKLSLVTTRDIENTTLPLSTSMVLRSSSKLSDSDSSSNQSKKSTTSTSITTTSLSASEDGSSLNSLTSLTHAKMVTSTPLETPLLSPSSQKDGESGNFVLSNETSYSGSRKSKSSSSSHISQSIPYQYMYSPISSRLRSQTRKEQELMSSSSSTSSENTSSGKTRPKGGKYANEERSPPIEEIYLPVAEGVDSSTSEETVKEDSGDERMSIIISQDIAAIENNQRSVSVIKEFRTPMGNQFTIRTDYDSPEGAVTGVQVTVKLEEDIPEIDILAVSDPIKTEAESSTQSAENEVTVKTEDDSDCESLSDSQLTVITEDVQTTGSSTGSQISIKTEDSTEDNQNSQTEGHITEQEVREQNLLDLDQSEITIKTDSSQYESLPVSLRPFKDEDTLMEQDLEGETSSKYETEDSQEESPTTEETELESQESQVTEDTDQDFKEESQTFEDSEQDSQDKSRGTTATVDSMLEESRSSVSSSSERRQINFQNRNYGFKNPESLQTAVDEFITLVRSEMDKEDDLLKEKRRMKKTGKNTPDQPSDQSSDQSSSQSDRSLNSNSSEGDLPYERFLPPKGTAYSFTALVPPYERTRLLRERDVQREAAENWRLSLNSMIDLDDEQLMSRCLPSDDEQVIFNLLSPENDDQISVRSIGSTETTTCELYIVNNRLVERFSDDDDKTSDCSDSVRSYCLFETEQGMALRSGRIIPSPNEFTYVADNLAALFGKMSLKDKEVKAAEEQPSSEVSITPEEVIKPPEPVYISLRGRQVRLKTENIGNVVYQVHRLEVERNNKKLGLHKRMKRKKPKKPMSEEDKLLELKAQMINMRSTKSSTLYSYGKDCTHLAPKTETQQHPNPVNCTMNCGKKKKGTCTSTGEPVCSYKCYQKNINRCKKTIRRKLDTDDHIHIILIEHEVDELPDPSTSGIRFVPHRKPEPEKPEEVREEQSEEETADDETAEESEQESSEYNYEEETEDEDED